MNPLFKKQSRALALGLAFLAPNIAGFLLFTFLPLVSSLFMAFTNWDLRYHNLFNQGSIAFLGLDNFKRLLAHPDFWQYFGNTLFLMIGIPFSIAASLGAALLLHRQPRRNRTRSLGISLAGIVLGVACIGLAMVNGQSLAFAILLGGVFTMLMVGGAFGGGTFYRTLYYLPNFTAGVATYLMWKKMYDPRSGPINAFLQPVLDQLSSLATILPSESPHWLLILFRLGAIGSLFFGGRAVARFFLRERSYPFHTHLKRKVAFRSVALLAVSWSLWQGGSFGRDMLHHAAEGLAAPEWLSDTSWAKPAIMLMSFWAAIGSNNMLLYLAGLSNIPEDLHEAASIDGANAFQQFCHVTWPQLAPITFFIVIMSVISGLQGGFEMARTMTQGGPGGATTTLSYFIYNEGFETGRLGYASAIAWTLFLFVLVATLFNWKFAKTDNA